MRTVQQLLQDVKPGKAEAAFSPVFRTQKLGDRGPMLPIGRAAGDQVLRDFRFRRPSSALEIALGDLRNDSTLRNRPGRLLAACLGESLEVLCGEDLRAKDKTTAARELLVRSLPWFDVVYLVIWRAMERRLFSAEPPLAQEITCPRCHRPIRRMKVDFESAQIPIWDWTPQNPPRAVVALKEPLQFGSASTSRLVLAPPTWGRCTDALTEDDVRNEARMDVAAAAASIVAGEDGQEPSLWAATPADAVAELMEWDRKLITGASGLVGGDLYPLLPQVAIRCQACEDAGVAEDEVGRVGIPVRWRDMGFW